MTTVTQTWTLDADWATWTLESLNYSAVANQLQLDAGPAAGTFHYLCVPVTNTNVPGIGLVRINAQTGEVIGAYRTAPEGFVTDPKALCVDSLGNVWVGNSAEASGGQGSVCKVGLLLGGTRCDSDGTVNPTGLYRKAPFTYNTAADRGTAGVYLSSFGLTDVLGWINATDGAGGVTGIVEDASDECVLLYQRTATKYVHCVVVIPGDDVWIGGWDPSGAAGAVVQSMVKLDETDASVLDTLIGQPANSGTSTAGQVTSNQRGGFYSAHSGTARLWTCDPTNPNAEGSFVQINLATRQSSRFQNQVGDKWYGIAEETASGLFYTSTGAVFGANPDERRLQKWNDLGTSQTLFGTGGVFVLTGTANRSLAVTQADGHIWVASFGANTVQHINDTNPGSTVGSINVGAGLGGVLGLGPDGICVDTLGKVWVACTSSGSLVRIDPALAAGVGAVELAVSLGNGAGPVAIGTMMAGSVTTASVQPSGVGTVVYTGSSPYTEWTTISWHETVPALTTLRVEYRVAATLDLLPLQAWVLAGTHTGVVAANTSRSVSMGGRIGKFVGVRVSFDRPTTEAATPDLRDLTILGATYAEISHPVRDPAEPILLDPVYSYRTGIVRRPGAEAGEVKTAGAVASWATIPQSERG